MSAVEFRLVDGEKIDDSINPELMLKTKIQILHFILVKITIFFRLVLVT